MKRTVDPFDYAGHICKTLPGGILLTTKRGEEVNSMTIGWGCIGIDWSRPIFIAYVRESRYTKQLLEANGEFTVNVSLGEQDRRALSLCGRKSGRDMNKIEKLNLTLEEPVSVSVPGIREFPLTLECKVLYKQQQDLSAIPEDILAKYYPVEADTLHPGSERDYHIAYYAQIMNAYIIED